MEVKIIFKEILKDVELFTKNNSAYTYFKANEEFFKNNAKKIDFIFQSDKELFIALKKNIVYRFFETHSKIYTRLFD